MAEATPGWVRRLLGPTDLQAIQQAIAAAEARTSGEIRVHLERVCPDEPLLRARAAFTALGIDRTAQRNGILIYVSIEDRKLAVVGDAGIDARVLPTFWRRICTDLAAQLRAGRAGDGLVAAVHEVGEALRRVFPRARGDHNELPDDVSID